MTIKQAIIGLVIAAILAWVVYELFKSSQTAIEGIVPK